MDSKNLEDQENGLQLTPFYLFNYYSYFNV